MNNAYLRTVVFLSGGTVLAIEILGTRILAPFYGASLFLWSALISVTLAALSIGYVLGGRWADKGATLTRMSYLLAGAGIWMLFVPWIAHPTLETIEPLGLRLAVLLAATILFFPPLILLGMVSPYAIKLKTSGLDVVGRTAGNLYAISTIASVLSALLMGFYLIPNVGVKRLTIIIGFLLLATATPGFGKKKILAFAVVAVSIVALTFVFAFWQSFAETDADGVVAVEQSPYGELRVVDTQVGRHLLIDGGVHTIVETGSWRSVFPYVAVLDIPQYMFDKPGTMLLIGLGGGSVAKEYSRKGWGVDAVEIDGKVIQLAYGFFGLRPEEAKMHNVDGRRFLSSNSDSYDVIIVDAFGSSSIPFDLVTRESFGLLAAHLNNHGVLAVNLESVGWQSILVQGIAATMMQHFKNVIALPLAEPPNTIGNLILLASNDTLRLLHELERDYTLPQYRFSMQYHRNHAWDNRFAPDIRGAHILTDDLNPVDVWAEAINHEARKNLHAYFQKSGLSW